MDDLKNIVQQYEKRSPWVHHNGSYGTKKNNWRYGYYKSAIDFSKEDFNVPDNLLLITCHNRKDSFFEKQMRDYGCKDYKVLNLSLFPWSNTLRLRPYVKYLENEAKEKEYVLFVDSDDVWISRSPELILNRFLDEFACDLLYNATYYGGGYGQDEKAFAQRQMAEEVHRGKFLNAGAYIGRKDFIIEVYKDVLNYVTDDDPPAQSWYRNPKKFGEGFPKGCGSDQVILRHLEFKYYPRLQIDKDMKLMARK